MRAKSIPEWREGRCGAHPIPPLTVEMVPRYRCGDDSLSRTPEGAYLARAQKVWRLGHAHDYWKFTADQRGDTEARLARWLQWRDSVAQTYFRWEVFLTVASPVRPGVQHQLRYTVQAVDEATAVKKATDLAETTTRPDGPDGPPFRWTVVKWSTVKMRPVGSGSYPG